MRRILRSIVKGEKNHSRYINTWRSFNCWYYWKYSK
jgi:hypothetical protein